MLKPTPCPDCGSVDCGSTTTVTVDKEMLVELVNARAIAARYLEVLDYELTKRQPDLDRAYDFADKLKSQIELARIFEASITRREGGSHE